MKVRTNKLTPSTRLRADQKARRVIAACEAELGWGFIHAAGPGGQNINKVSTAVQLRFDLRGSRSLTEEAREMLMRAGGRRIAAEGILIIEARRRRTQAENRAEALSRFESLLRAALAPPKVRHATRPTPSSIDRRIEAKRRRAKLKNERRASVFE